ncbi:hypothetical protein [Salinarimonas ramus]|uniref:Uncharacterized protein n=1 Tax=Salinarimonas ramus TaxID=690164 RepID=A0A917V6M4_9HYPH|nr:hypothetical protein [Salinarimonas ramus]GGK43828.1 hypothetical protein GCM10011322_33610 [Salinarimonas ramus]
MSRISSIALALAALVLAPAALSAQESERGDMDATGSVGAAIDQPTPAQLRRLRGEEDGASGELPPPEALDPGIDILAPAPDEFQEP